MIILRGKLRRFVARSWALSWCYYRLHGLALTGRPGEYVWYFAYGANMHDSAFRGWRGMRPLDWRPGRVRGFRLRFTAAVDPMTAQELASYLIEHYRYEYSGAYGSPELERTRLAVENIELADDGRTVDLTAPLVKDRVYAITARGVRSAGGEALVHPTGVYTLNVIPQSKD